MRISGGHGFPVVNIELNNCLIMLIEFHCIPSASRKTNIYYYLTAK